AKAQIIKSLAVEKETPERELSLANDKLVFGDHEYSENTLGKIEDIANITQLDLKKFVKNKLAKDNLYVGMAGDLTSDDARYLLDKIFGDLSEKSLGKKLDDVVLDFSKPNIKIDRKDGQNIVVFTTNGTCRKCEDFYPLYVANYIFGGAGLNSKLNQKIREKEGLTYGAYSSMILSDKANLLTVGFSTTKDNFEKAVSMFRDEWKNYAQNGFDEDDVKFAKDYLISSYNLRFASILGIADMLVMQQKFDLGLDFLNKRNDYVKNVSAKSVSEAAKKYFTENLLQAQIGTFN
ncbi:MAG: insulinase family protein, partial [Alphaproteobacteria bacterium]|nr:insulinase family protein [Alphaproteobacteria bacterium]